jgi:MFS family permease
MHGNVARPKASHIFYGWFVVAAGFAVTFVGFGCVYSFTAFIDALQREFGASRGSVSMVFSLAAFLYFGLGSISGPLADRFGSRRMAVAGMLLVGLGLAAVAAARSLGQVYAVYGLAVGIGVGLSYVPAMGAVQRWFTRRRAFASGLASSGIGVGTLVAPPLAALLVAHLGWRPAYVVLGVTAAIIGGGLALLIENDPRDRPARPCATRSGRGASSRCTAHASPARWACSCRSSISGRMRSTTASRIRPRCCWSARSASAARSAASCSAASPTVSVTTAR